MTDYVLSIDPGVSTGIALLSYDAETPAQLVQGWQFSGGVAGLVKWLGEHWDSDPWDDYNDQPNTRGFYGWRMGVDEPLSVEPSTEWVYSEDGGDVDRVEVPANTTVITEKFTARNTRGFSYTTASLEPLRGEGALIALGLMPDYDVKERRWRDPAGQYIFGGGDLAAKKSSQHRWLKENGFYRTNKDFPDSPSKDGADDFRSAAAHGVAYIAKVCKHEPTFRLLTGESE